MNNEPTIYINIPANKGRQIKAGTPIICFERFRFPFRNKAQRADIGQFIRNYKRNSELIEEALRCGTETELIPAYILRWV